MNALETILVSFLTLIGLAIWSAVCWLIGFTTRIVREKKDAKARIIPPEESTIARAMRQSREQTETRP